MKQFLSQTVLSRLAINSAPYRRTIACIIAFVLFHASLVDGVSFATSPSSQEGPTIVTENRASDSGVCGFAAASFGIYLDRVRIEDIRSPNTLDLGTYYQLVERGGYACNSCVQVVDGVTHYVITGCTTIGPSYFWEWAVVPPTATGDADIQSPGQGDPEIRKRRLLTDLFAVRANGIAFDAEVQTIKKFFVPGNTDIGGVSFDAIRALGLFKKTSAVEIDDDGIRRVDLGPPFGRVKVGDFEARPSLPPDNLPPVPPEWTPPGGISAQPAFFHSDQHHLVGTIFECCVPYRVYTIPRFVPQ